MVTALKRRLLDRRDAIAGAQLPRNRRVFIRGKPAGGLFPRAASRPSVVVRELDARSEWVPFGRNEYRL